jgi:hypothetical protein
MKLLPGLGSGRLTEKDASGLYQLNSLKLNTIKHCASGLLELQGINNTLVIAPQ